jgi:hypothetical protein
MPNAPFRAETTEMPFTHWMWHYGIEGILVVLAGLLLPRPWNLAVLGVAAGIAVMRLTREQRLIASTAKLDSQYHKHIWSGNLMIGALLAFVVVGSVLAGTSENDVPVSLRVVLNALWLLLIAVYAAAVARLSVLRVSPQQREVEVEKLELAHELARMIREERESKNPANRGTNEGSTPPPPTATD